MNSAIRQLVHLFFFFFLIRQLVRKSFLIRQLVTHRSCDLFRVVFSIAFTVCALTKYTPPFNGSCTSPNVKKHFFAVCLNSLFTEATYTQYRLRHVHHMEIMSFRLDRKFSSKSVAFRTPGPSFPLAPLRSDCSQLGVPKPLVTNVGRGSAVRPSPVRLHVQRKHLGSSLRR